MAKTPSSKTSDAAHGGGLRCPRCGVEMHPLFLYEDREPDTWLCFECGHLEWTAPGKGRPVPSVDE